MDPVSEGACSSAFKTVSGLGSYEELQIRCERQPPSLAIAERGGNNLQGVLRTCALKDFYLKTKESYLKAKDFYRKAKARIWP